MFHWSLLSVALLTLALSVALRREKPRDEIIVARMKNGARDEIIVARFNEDLSWLEKYKGDYDITVYNKGPNSAGNFNQIKLPNVGMEAHTYLWHIVNRYDTLAPRTVFIMGSAVSREDRRPIMITLFNKLKTHKISEFDVTCHDVDDLKQNQYNFSLDEIEKSTKENKDVVNVKKLDPSPERPFGKWYETNFGDYQSKKVCFVPNFAVTREDIRKKPKSYYKHLLDKYLSEDFKNPEVAHYFERAWYAIFYSSL
jgi:hypothetical protein